MVFTSPMMFTKNQTDRSIYMPMVKYKLPLRKVKRHLFLCTAEWDVTALNISKGNSG